MKITDAAKALTFMMKLPNNPKALELAHHLLDLHRSDDLKQHAIYQELNKELESILRRDRNRVA